MYEMLDIYMILYGTSAASACWKSAVIEAVVALKRDALLFPTVWSKASLEVFRLSLLFTVHEPTLLT